MFNFYGLVAPIYFLFIAHYACECSKKGNETRKSKFCEFKSVECRDAIKRKETREG